MGRKHIEAASLQTDVPTEFTLQFVRTHVPAGAARILEVGCGDGSLATALTLAGFGVVAIDSDAQCVRQAVERGLDARCAAWPQFVDQPAYDAVLFVRSLHHIAPLEEAVAHATAVLAPGGRVIVEDFAFDEVDAATAAWFQDRLKYLRREVNPTGGAECFAAAIADAPDPVEAWRHHHTSHEAIHTGSRLREVLHRYLEPVYESTAPYLFRYVQAWAGQTPISRDLETRFLKDEVQAVRDGHILAIGRRFVGALGGTGKRTRLPVPLARASGR